ncbi:hypothetical protein CAPTEDRAFT_218810 [Capitella teleta]|uniref:Chloride channel protein n=1 Tax=Capitella teleta TaxID=283909 RepID=R7U737_CAPTE|nr:hypothetical protein CAPTEDRAFT_218810 [Capitella teleta]|eukprot:ELU02185.1 hypothetical protein CAPTEDRAFT_218810 [Capitella teleta]
MYGKYSRDLGEFAKTEAARISSKSWKPEETPSGFTLYYRSSKCRSCHKCLFCTREAVTSLIVKIGEDWIFLTLLGVIMALLSFLMDYVIGKCQTARQWMFEELEFSVAAQFITWILFPFVFICFSTGFVHIVGSNAIGSGIPEMKTILRGVVLKEYLTFRTLVSKVVGLCTSLGCGLPVGKEGPFVHVASIVASLLGKFLTSFKGIYDNESRSSEMLAAACAVGVACTFAAPIGGVLFSIEVTATYFAVRNYWRGFYSAVCGAFVFRLLAIWFKDEETLTALFKTSLRQDFPFDIAELLSFAIIGIVCGFAGALFVYTHRKFVEFIRKQKKVSSFLQRNRFIFPGVVSTLIMSFLFPPGLGQFMAGQLTNHDAVNELFSNFTWSLRNPDSAYEEEILDHWEGPLGNVYVSLVLFMTMRFWMTAVSITLPVPAGVFMPVFTIGAAFGRLMGECMAVWFPGGLGGHVVVPGGYAIVGAAALSGSVTHTISTSVIVFELTGQMGHVLPCVIAVLISNAVATALTPSIYDSLIQIKKLPYLPDIINPDAINAHRIFVDSFMVRDLEFLSSDSTYAEARDLLQRFRFRAFPLIDTRDNMILLGSIQRNELLRMLDDQLTLPSKVAYFEKRNTQLLPDDTTGGATGQGPPPVRSDSVLSGGSQRFAVNRVQSSNGETESERETEDSRHVQFKTTLDLSLLTPEEEELWENAQLNREIDYEAYQIDPAPFQLVEKTSLYKVHSLFSLLSLNHAYVTNTGRLVGIVSLKEVRSAIQGYTMSSANRKASMATTLLKTPSERSPESADIEMQSPGMSSA